jgi:hypothetical protein
MLVDPPSRLSLPLKLIMELAHHDFGIHENGNELLARDSEDGF